MILVRLFACGFSVAAWVTVLVLGAPLLPVVRGTRSFDIVFWGLVTIGMLPPIGCWLLELKRRRATTDTSRKYWLSVSGTVLAVGVFATFMFHRISIMQHDVPGLSIRLQFVGALVALAVTGAWENRRRRFDLLDLSSLGYQVLSLFAVSLWYVMATGVYFYTYTEASFELAVILSGGIASFGTLWLFIVAIERLPGVNVGARAPQKQ